MDRKKVLQGLFTGLSIADAYEKSGNKISPEVGLAAFFDRRFSDASALGSHVYDYLRCCRKDLPILNEREEGKFVSGSNRLAYYLYRAPLAKGLILYVHGMAGMADDQYAVNQAELLRRGYDVFAIDLTASGRSEGRGIPGLHQSALDVAAAGEYIASRYDLNGMPLFLFGHSWGGYGVAASLTFLKNVKAVASFSGFDSPLKEMVAIPAAKVGMPFTLPTDQIEEPLKMRAGPYYDLSASDAIASSNVPTLLVHGDLDTTVPLKTASIMNFAHGGEVERLLLPNRGHMDVFYSDRSNAYAETVRAMMDSYAERYGKTIDRIPVAEWEELLSRFDPRMASEVDEAVFDRVDDFFMRHS